MKTALQQIDTKSIELSTSLGDAIAAICMTDDKERGFWSGQLLCIMNGGGSWISIEKSLEIIGNYIVANLKLFR